ncbi:MAG: Xaa-Pro peptidase family protein [Halofilum sp. (in: g-proteobacteria)]|nr:Xaa-Pro peptidase family protein [Halofilum sp. (in: g-proteobacteria)]
MGVHFTTEELAERRASVARRLDAQGLDALLCFRQESMYWLSGYDTFGYCFFQCLVLDADGGMALLTREPDRRQAAHTSVIEDVRIWVDREGVNPAEDLRALLAELGLEGRRVGVEYEAYGLTGRNARRLDAVLAGFCETADASEIVSRERAVKSPSEMACIRRAAGLADDALDGALALAGEGAWEGDILADMQGAVFRGGGDYPGNEFIIGSGPDALLCRYFSGRRHLEAGDQLTLEWAGVYHRYHAAMMRTLLVGEPHREHRDMHAVAADAMAACIEACAPGRTAGDVFDAHARTVDAAGLGPHRLNACGYGMGATFAPMWMDWPMFYGGNPVELVPGMALFIHIILMNSDSGRAMTLGQTVEVTEAGAIALHRHGTELLVV